MGQPIFVYIRVNPSLSRGRGKGEGEGKGKGEGRGCISALFRIINTIYFFFRILTTHDHSCAAAKVRHVDRIVTDIIGTNLLQNNLGPTFPAYR